MNLHMDVTPLVNPISWSNVAFYQPIVPDVKSQYERTAFSVKADPFDFFAPESGPNSPTAISKAQVDAEITSTLNESLDAPKKTKIGFSSSANIELLAKHRVQLLAAKYANGTESPEITARLEILNHRLLDRAPRVSTEQVLALEHAHEQLMQIQLAREERSRRLGIPD